MRAAALILACLLVPCAAWAQALDLSKGGAVEVTSLDGMEWRQNENMVIARGSARAVRGDTTVTADRLIARYRRKASAGATPAAPQTTPGTAGDTGNNEIYRLEAEGNVHIFTPTDLAVSDRAIYDIDQAVLLLTGSAMKITTPQQVMTARDSMEYWSQKHMAVGRGNAVVNTSDGRRLSADTLVGYTTPPAGTPAPASTAPKPPRAGDPLAASGKLQRVEAFGNVEVRTATETFRGNRAIYVADSSIARLAGEVRVTRGQNQLNGDEAVVNMATGIYTMSRAPGGRVQGLVVPNDTTTPSPAPGTPRPPSRPGP